MAKDKSDKATRDLLNPNPRGGFRVGAGRKRSRTPNKVKIGWRISSEVKGEIEEIAKSDGCSAGDIVEKMLNYSRKILINTPTNQAG